MASRRWPGAVITGIELQDFPAPAGYHAWLHGRFQEVAPTLAQEFDLVMGNPPYVEAEAFTRIGLALLAPRGRLVYLLNQSFQASQRRGWALFQEQRPRWIFPCVPRPSFTGDGHTAKEEYAFYVWQEGYRGPTETVWLRKEEVAATWKRSRGQQQIYPSAAERQRQYRARQKAR